jgi:hypothetical protein
MSRKENLQMIYAEAMRHHPYGYPLYQPCNTKSLKLGSCGYLNEYGDWNHICNVLDGTQPFDKVQGDLQLGDTESMTWLPKCSEHVRETKFKANAKA